LLIGAAALGACVPRSGHDTLARLPGSNPLITTAFTADPAPLVVGDTVYLYTSHDKATGKVLFAMDDWLAFSSKDLRHWTELGPVMHETDFAWATATKSAWAAQAVEKNGKFYFYAPVKHQEPDLLSGEAQAEHDRTRRTDRHDQAARLHRRAVALQTR
jgi:hypothetical protein